MARPLPRWSLCVLSALHAALFGWAAIMLPWRSWTVFALLCALLALAHLAVALLSALKHRWLALVWRIQAAMALSWLAYVVWGLLTSAWYLSTLYRGLGPPIAGALVGIVVVWLVFTLPLALWGLIATGGVRWSKRASVSATVVLLVAGARIWLLSGEARGDVLPPARAAEVRDAMSTLDLQALDKPRRQTTSLASPAAVVCERLPAVGEMTLIASYITTQGDADKAIAVCVQGLDAAALKAQLSEHLKKEGRRAPVKLDLIVTVGDVPEGEPMAPLSLRPGLDGICAGKRCLMPWQLVMFEAFNSHAPLASVPDARMGASLEKLRKLLGEDSAPLKRIATASWLASPARPLADLDRSAMDVTLDEKSIRRAVNAAQLYVTAAQNRDGRFKYLVDPFSGHLQMGDFSIARQAGTTLVICELASDNKHATRVVNKSLDMLATLEEKIDARAHTLGVMPFRLRLEEPTRRVGPTSLSLAAFLRCRDRTGDVHDALIGRLARHLLWLQRQDGGFHHHIDRKTGEPRAITKTIFVDGQIVLSLVLLEAIADQSEHFPPKAELHNAVERAMNHFGSQYWDLFIDDFFYLEENWHCLAAAAALDVHRHAAYEKFCLDYIAFKSRIVLDASSGVSDDFIGGYGITTMVPPHNTATGGFGEALAAGLKIKKASNMDTTEDEARMRAVLTFLLRNQWQRGRCFACSPRRRVIGGFSEHMASPKIRIDYVQHAWAALGHGGRVLGLL